MKHLVTAAIPVLVAACTLPALAAHTPLTSRDFQDLKDAAWGVVLPGPADLLLKRKTPGILFDGLDIQRERPVKVEPRNSAKAVQKPAKSN